MSRSDSSRRMRRVNLEAAYQDAKLILTPRVHSNTDEWRLARAQWHYDYGDRELAESELRDLNALRAAYDHEQPGKYPPLDLRR